MTETEPDFVIEETNGFLPPQPPPGLFTERDHGGPKTLPAKAKALIGAVLPGASTSAIARGWGTPSQAFAQKNVVKITGRGITLYVHREVAYAFGCLLVDLDDHLRTKGRSLARRADDWGLALRRIAGSSAWSNHAFGLAVDFDAIDNPQGRALVTEFNPGFIDNLLKTKYKGLFRWGGRYGGTTKKDAMHFEFMGTILQARTLTASLRAKPTPVNGHSHVLPLLAIGSHDPVVNDLQGHLNYAYHQHPEIAPLVIDGHFDLRTQIRLRDWQKRTGIKVTGQADRATWLRLHQVTGGIRWDFNRKPF